MSRQVMCILGLVLVISLVTSPASANWMGKRGDKPDLFSMLLEHQPSHVTDPVAKLSAVEALAAIDNIIATWKQQSVKSSQR